MKSNFPSLTPLEAHLLARLDGLPARLPISLAAPLMGASIKAIYAQLDRERGIFSKIVQGEEGEDKWIALGDVARVMLGQKVGLKENEEGKKKVGRPSNQNKAARQQGGANA